MVERVVCERAAVEAEALECFQLVDHVISTASSRRAENNGMTSPL